MSSYELAYSSRFKKDYMKPHKLTGNYLGTWECHILHGLLLIWQQTESPKEIYLMRLGSHSEWNGTYISMCFFLWDHW
ncbi:type II toxin-antitoxin system mRNA interferase toxin, RelE/StbE family [Mongoliibacter ruber]|uniref:type II toxin-antitoxin system mRNA interferase toxin, RelE/StbE family n=1 Tax=Mongoliibacter ruber TaxID=1750599 RepID=UPI000D0762D4